MAINKTLGNLFKGDKVIWMVFFFLCLISAIEVFSASSSLTYKGGSYLAPIVKHLGILFLGIVFMVFTVNIPCRYFKVLTPILMLISSLTLAWVSLAGPTTNGAQRWISLLGLQFQPSELGKGTLVLAVAQILSATQTGNGADKKALKIIASASAFIVPFIFIENLSTAVLLCVVVYMMMILGRVPVAQLGKILGVVVVLAGSLLAFVLIFGHAKPTNTQEQGFTETVTEEKTDKSSFAKIFHRADTWKSRIFKFVKHEEVPPEKFDLDKDAQVGHANIAIASSNIIGQGPGNSVQRDFLSQAFSDFIYAVIIEEMGIFGAIFVALLYVVLLFRTGKIAKRCENNFPPFLAMGLALLLVTQALFNMCVAVGLVPVTGQPLPLISKGGTSTIINCIFIGAIISVSRTAKKAENVAKSGETEKK
ncbi:MAG: FtsW/RodA/SpoVE family cell cycle protein [Prevotella shahii]|uniref:FtsW/RodA/SpoVE family cell cycle protein n=1 Tax=Hoylesella shahii TaxID=228603 RepID=UPI001CAABD9C|nr:FtsW/RodA/SpoVE family cell cycle protein [Hoylesella shahii]MBF1567605.1 FtsW/RodA/SpoVE family cell cycle protein [Hoylesella shahii]